MSSVTSVTVKSLLHGSVAEAVYNEIVSRSSKYYYYLGKTLRWYNEIIPPVSSDTEDTEKQIRRDIILVKEIKPGDVAFVVPRYDWTPGTVYDPYDDAYGDGLVGVNIKEGGVNYSANAVVTVTGGNALVSAVVTPVINILGTITGLNVDFPGYGYNSAPTVTITDSTGTGAEVEGVICLPPSGASSLAESKFYVITDDFNIYKCLDNNRNAPSTAKPVGTLSDPFLTSDGYKWKYMGTILPAQRTRFLSLDFMPVTRAVTDNFYSSGEIKSVVIQSAGQGYTTASVSVSGDGYLKDNPVYITTALISNSGHSYTTANISIAPPVSYNSLWSNSTPVFTGTVLKHINNIYEVVLPGTTGNTGPVHAYGTYSNGTSGLKYRGTVATGNVTVASGNITSVTLDGIVGEINVTNAGIGYIYPPVITISGGGGSGASAYSVLSGNIVKKIAVTNVGTTTYTSTPTVTIGTAWTANSRVFLQDQLSSSGRLYTVIQDSGNLWTQLGSVAPTHLSGNVASGNAILSFAGNVATAVAVLRYGTGYITQPLVTVNGDGANADIDLSVSTSDAQIELALEDGKIISATVVDGGIGYSSVSLTVAGNGTGAEIEANLSQGDLISVQANNELLAIDGTVDRIALISKGFNYTAANVTIDGDGIGATAQADIVNGRIERINVLNRGQGYTSARVTIIGDGLGASARCILPPSGGHGKNITTELFARNLAFFTSIISEKNQGFEVSNDYRQFGLIKNLLTNDNERFFTGSVGSACWSITSPAINSSITPDTILTSTSNARYIVVSKDNNKLLVTSVDGVDPIVGNILSVEGQYPFTISSVIPPDIDKYSGKFLYVDNRTAFTTVGQTVSLKTIFKY